MSIPWNTLFYYICRNLWKERNEFTFLANGTQILNIHNTALAQPAECTHLVSQTKKKNTHVLAVKWSPPPVGWHKLNIDASGSHNPRDISFGGVIRDERGKWVKGYSGHLSFSFMINDFFPGAKELKQGDPVSPYLFVLAMKYFKRLVMDATQHREFHFQPKCKKIQLTHATFADDLMVFSRGDLQSVSIWKKVIAEFSSVSRLNVNFTKSLIFVGGVINETF
ncbi:hypothetical protein L6164_007214 [Bauhinia variegata]|uniref:Uncharacterized protein n=1 Tax=Bauhinia variegata TaxID=167791 RepID=A0ACB9PD61_BAUVA|nr:hypothetical protein L6164_007214 [Bauhinia variegata]